ncbi:hypothetical protein [Telluribacter humicola]|uniref:hypothetical protein n=1 Tax=Telluribacter humicola TaxID=1720261 RepID=UPI001A978173|nr:hypothetical protein [Telluribacter humicola]
MKNTFLTLLLLVPLAATQASSPVASNTVPSTIFLQQVPADKEAPKEQTKKKKKRKLRIRKKVMNTPRSF